jgi:molecular chaperone DnaK
MEQLVGDLVDRSMGPVEQALKDAEISPSDIDEVVLAGSQTRMPLVQEAVRKFFGKEPYKSLDPKEIVSMGAAIQAAVLSGEVKDVVLLDVTPLTLGIETLGGVATPIIERNTTIPTKKSQIFSTASDSQTSVEIHVVQGERPMAADNKTLGRFNLDGIPPSPRGIPQIEVSFDFDSDGIMHVSALDKATAREQKITITASSGLSKSEVENMVRVAEQHAEQDRKRKEEAEARNQGDSLAYSAEKTLRDLGDKVPAAVRSEVEGKVAAVRSALQGQDVQRIRSTSQELSEAVQRIGASMYQQPGGTNQPPPGGQPGDQAQGPGPSDDGTVEGEFREV